MIELIKIFKYMGDMCMRSGSDWNSYFVNIIYKGMLLFVINELYCIMV